MKVRELVKLPGRTAAILTEAGEVTDNPAIRINQALQQEWENRGGCTAPGTLPEELMHNNKSVKS